MIEGMMPEQPAQSPMLPPMEQPEPIVLSRDAMLAELHAWGKGFISRSKEWRKSSKETEWLKWARASASIYDQELKAKKEPWQSTAFWPITASHRENAQSQLFKTEVGPRPPLDVKARKGLVPAEMDQSENIKDLVLREREKSAYEVARNGVIDDKTTYGSGFAQVYFETKIEDRMVKEPIYAEINPNDPASMDQAMQGQRPILGYQSILKPQVIYRGVRFRDLSIWDVFPDPQSLQIKGHPIALRYKITYGEIVDGAKPSQDEQTGEEKPGYVLPEAVAALASVASEEVTPEDQQELKADRGIADIRVQRTDYGRLLECFEIQARLPKKWVLINGEEIDNPEALIPARVRIHEQCVISVMLNDSYDGEPDIYKDDYMPVKGEFYGMGIPEMLKDSQAVANESINQRLDFAKIGLLNVYAVIEKSVVDPKDFSLGPGSVLRLKSSDGLTKVDELFKRVDMGSVDRAAFIEPQEWERAAQERTSITQTTLGTENNRDMTLGAQHIQQGVTGTKLAYLGMLSEFGFQREIFRAYYKLIYQNYTPQDYIMALGQERGSMIIPMSPEILEASYQYYPLGIFEMENKATRQARMAGWDQQFGMMPWADRVEVAKSELQSMDEDPDRFIIPEAEAVQIMVKAQEMAHGMAQQMVAEQQAQAPGKPEGGPSKAPQGPAQ